jgi:hypothetical protein
MTTPGQRRGTREPTLIATGVEPTTAGAKRRTTVASADAS